MSPLVEWLSITFTFVTSRTRTPNNFIVLLRLSIRLSYKLLAFWWAVLCCCETVASLSEESSARAWRISRGWLPGSGFPKTTSHYQEYFQRSQIILVRSLWVCCSSMAQMHEASALRRKNRRTRTQLNLSILLTRVLKRAGSFCESGPGVPSLGNSYSRTLKTCRQAWQWISPGSPPFGTII